MEGLCLRPFALERLDIVAVTHIFNYLSVSTLMICACVCKKWNEWSNYDHLWQWRLALLEQYTSSRMVPANLKRLKTLLNQPPFPSPIFSPFTPVNQMHEKFNDTVTKLWVSLLLGVANHYTFGVTVYYRGPSLMIEACETGVLCPKRYYFDPIAGEVGIVKYHITGIMREKLMYGNWQLLYDKVKERLAPLHI